MIGVQWLDEPEEHDYKAAEDYLSLLVPPQEARAMARELKNNSVLIHRKAKDLLRASGLALLPEDNKHVAADLAKIRHGKPLSPVLLIRGELGHYPLQFADGYHRVVASYLTDENTDIPCVISP